MRLWLIRHGETTLTAERRYCGHADPPLSARGRRQARALARLLPRGVPVWSSDLLRARETVALACDAPPRTSPAFRELDFGRFDGRGASECEAIDREAFRAFIERPGEARAPGGEGLVDLARRVRAGLAALRSQTEGPVAVLVAHGGPIRVLVLDALGLPLTGFNRLSVDPGSASLLEWWGREATLRHLNLVPGRSP